MIKNGIVTVESKWDYYLKTELNMTINICELKRATDSHLNQVVDEFQSNYNLLAALAVVQFCTKNQS